MIRTAFFCLICLISLSGCSSHNKAPTDQLIEGPFNITETWQTINLEKPLTVLPQLHYIQLLLAPNSFVQTENVPVDEFNVSRYGYRLSNNQQPIYVSVILVNRQGKEFRPADSGYGTIRNPLGTFKFLMFSPNSNQDKFYYPKDTEITAIKVKANIPFRVEHLSWSAFYYHRNPHAKWSELDPTEIVMFE